MYKVNEISGITEESTKPRQAKPPMLIQVIQSGLAEGEQLIQQIWDKIFITCVGAQIWDKIFITCVGARQVIIDVNGASNASDFGIKKKMPNNG